MAKGPNQRPGIKDVAAGAGVSITTVSHALNGRGRVQPETRDRVLAVAEKLGYIANVHAQRLATGENQAIAIQVSGYGSNIAGADSAYYIELLNGASAAALDHGYMPMLMPLELSSTPQTLPVDGSLVIDPTGGESLIRLVTEAGGIVVTAGRPLENRDLVSGWVDNDLPGLTLKVLEHFVSRGYKRPAVLSGPKDRSYSFDTVNAYERWAVEHGIEPIVSIVEGNPTVDLGTRAVKELLSREDRPDALYTPFDTFARGALRAAEEMGIGVPESFGVAATVDSGALGPARIPITAFEIRPASLGSEAISILVSLISGQEKAPIGRTLPAKLIFRASTDRP